MTRPHQRTRVIPGLPADHQLAPDVIDAYWVAMSLVEQGWQFKRFDYHTASDTATVEAITPGGRAVTALHSMTKPVGDQRLLDPRLIQLAHGVAALGHNDRGTGAQVLLTQLCWLVQSGIKNPVRHQIRCRIDKLPILPAHEQPAPQVRCAAWTIAHLVVDKRWHIAELGQDTAAGGFIAEVPGEALVVYPAGGNGDGTPAGALAAIMATLSANDLQTLNSLDYRRLYAADQGLKK